MTFNIGNPSPHLNGRAPIVHCAHCVGGGSSVNFMNYTRSPASDFDDWEVDGWESKSLIPLMKKVLECAASVCIFVKLNCCHSWRHTRCKPIVQPTGTMDLSRYPPVGVK